MRNRKHLATHMSREESQRNALHADDPGMGSSDFSQQLERPQAKVVMNDMMATKCVQFVEASSKYIEQILQTKYNPVFLCYFRGAFNNKMDSPDYQDHMNYNADIIQKLDDKDVNEILKYI